MTNPCHPDSCRTQAVAGRASGEAGAGSRRRLRKRAAAMALRVAHDFFDTLNAARRRKHPDKRTRHDLELQAEIARLKRALFRLQHSTRPRRAGRGGGEDHRPPF